MASFLMNSRETKHLPPQEWMAVITILLLSLVFIFSRQPHSSFIDQAHESSEQEVALYVQGAVENPGRYSVPKGSTIQELLNKLTIKQTADLTKLNLERILKEGQTITIPEKKMITIYLEGAVRKAGALRIPKGTKLQDLLTYIEFLPGADLSKLRKKRILKNNETIIINLVN